MRVIDVSLLAVTILGVGRDARPLVADAGSAPTIREIPAGHVVVGAERWAGRLRLLGAVHVAPGANLTLAPGTLVEARGTTTALVVDRDARIVAVGTLLEPVVLRCDGGAPEKGCWAGLIINGNAPIASGTMTSPAARGTGAAGCREQVGDGIAGPFGGCDPADSAGVLRFVRVEHASRGLELNGVGSRTVVEHVQVHASATDGVTVRGGTVELWRVLITDPGARGLAWRDGWSGRAQALGVQRLASDATPLLEGVGSAVGEGPTFHNVSLIGTGTGAALRFSGEGHVVLGNGLMVGMASALDLDGAAMCAAVSSGAVRVFETTLVAIGRLDDADTDAECPTAEGDVLQRTGENLQTFAAIGSPPLLVSGLTTALPDFRPRLGSGIADGLLPLGAGWREPEGTAVFRGMTPRIRVSGGELVPWFAGWTVDGAPPAVPFGLVTGTVASSAGAAIRGALVQVANADAPGISAADGGFTVGLARAGTWPLTVDSLPPGCSVAPQAVTVAANATVVANVVATCGAVVIQPSALRLTYICGNTFRVRNGNLAPVPVMWDVAGTSETGTLVLPPRSFAAAFSETFFATVATGTVRLFYAGAQVDVKANGGFVCP
jgi:hypothetical protein